MRVPPVAIPIVVMALPILSHAVGAEPENDAITRLKSCFQLDRAEQVECLEKLSRELPDRNVQSSGQPAKGTWVISETTSPVDYSPMITAATLSQSNAKDAPATFAIRCRGQRTDLVVSTEGWVARQRATGRLQDQRPARSQDAVDCIHGRTYCYLQGRCHPIFTVPAGWGANNNQRVRWGELSARSDISTCRIGCHSAENRSDMQMAAGSGQNIASGTLASDSTDLNQTLALFPFSWNQNRSAPLFVLVYTRLIKRCVLEGWPCNF